MHICKRKASNGELLKAVFCPEKGMNLMSLSRGNIEVLDQKTKPLFEKRMAGLGALIGPHFHHRPPERIPPLEDQHLFPFFKEILEKGSREFFSHGIGRYVPWQYKGDETTIEARLSGTDVYRGHKLEDLEGDSFLLHYKATLVEDGLKIDYSFKKGRPGVIGLHYYYALADLKGVVRSKVGSQYYGSGAWRPLEDKWANSKGELELHLSQESQLDFCFTPLDKNSSQNVIELETSTHRIQIEYTAKSPENSWQIYHPKDATYVCLEPVSAHNPRDARLTSGELKVHIKIF